MALWIATHWLDLLQSVGIVASLLFSQLSFRADAAARKVSNTFIVTAHHREIWSQIFRHPELVRVLQKKVDLEKEAVTAAEEAFVLTLIHHLSATVEAIDAGALAAPEGLRKDVRSFFSLPIPKEVWDRRKGIQDKRFVAFVERARR